MAAGLQGGIRTFFAAPETASGLAVVPTSPILAPFDSRPEVPDVSWKTSNGLGGGGGRSCRRSFLGLAQPAGRGAGGAAGSGAGLGAGGIGARGGHQPGGGAPGTVARGRAARGGGGGKPKPPLPGPFS